METSLEEITLAELLQLAMNDRQVELHVSMPAKVESYNASAQTADVVPQLNRSMPDGAGNYVTEKLPKLQAVPVVFPRCGQFGITFPVQAGDYGLLVFCERNIGAWRSTGTQGDPGDLGMHTLDGAVFIPGLFPDSKPASSASGSDMIIGSDTSGDSRIEIKASGGINLGAGATDGVLTGTDFESFLKAWSSAAAGTNDGGVLMRTNTLLALATAGWSPGASIFSLGSSKIKGVR